ncbi:MAG: helix-turn-helix transcriptional regulator [Paracoccaceae bacterium]
MSVESWRKSRVLATISMGNIWLYDAIATGEFPAPVTLSARAVGWRRGDVKLGWPAVKLRRLDPMGAATNREAMAGRELRRVIMDWSLVMRQATDDWAKTFAADIWKLSGNGQWRPTAQQAKVMKI